MQLFSVLHWSELQPSRWVHCIFKRNNIPLLIRTIPTSSVCSLLVTYAWKSWVGKYNPYMEFNISTDITLAERPFNPQDSLSCGILNFKLWNAYRPPEKIIREKLIIIRIFTCLISQLSLNYILSHIEYMIQQSNVIVCCATLLMYMAFKILNEKTNCYFTILIINIKRWIFNTKCWWTHVRLIFCLFKSMQALFFVSWVKKLKARQFFCLSHKIVTHELGYGDFWALVRVLHKDFSHDWEQ